MQAADLLPLEIWREIAMADVGTWYSLVRVVPDLYSSSDRLTLKSRGTRSEVRGSLTYHYLDDQIHRDADEGPAVHSESFYCYMTRGENHRDPGVGPAVSSTNLSCYSYWWRGKLHRPHREGPAIRDHDGTIKYYEMGTLHRPYREGPAVIFPDGEEQYWSEGEPHRDPREGPAVIFPDGTPGYYWKGERIEE